MNVLFGVNNDRVKLYRLFNIINKQGFLLILV